LDFCPPDTFRTFRSSQLELRANLTWLVLGIIRTLRQDSDAQLRAGAARALAGWEQDDAVQSLAAALRDESPVREAAAESLSEIKDAVVRRETVGVLGWLKSAAALPQLAKLVVEDPDPEVRRAVSVTPVGQYALQLSFSDGHDRAPIPRVWCTSWGAL
jgi:HEAT repeat protein